MNENIKKLEQAYVEKEANFGKEILKSEDANINQNFLKKCSQNFCLKSDLASIQNGINNWVKSIEETFNVGLSRIFHKT